MTEKLPKTATGKIQRRHMVTAFIKDPVDQPAAGESLALLRSVSTLPDADGSEQAPGTHVRGLLSSCSTPLYRVP